MSSSSRKTMEPIPERPGRTFTIDACERAGNASKHRCVCGRGPMMLMLPFSMLSNCGSSLILVLRRNLPAGRIRGSFFRVTVPVPMLGLFLSMVANLYSAKGWPWRPTRLCRKKISPSPVRRRKMAIGTSKGERTSNASPESRMSKNRCMGVTSARRGTCRFPCAQSPAACG